MTEESAFTPNWTSAPGDTISAALKERGLSVPEFAETIGRNYSFARDLLFGIAPIDPTIATKLNAIFGGSASFWINREAQYRKDVERLNLIEDESKREWVKALPILDMVRHGWIKRAKNAHEKFASCLEFFNVPNIQAWQRRYKGELSAVAFRTSPAFPSQPEAVLAWLRQGEIIGARSECQPWDKTKFESCLPEIRRLTRIKQPSEFLPKLRKICAPCGVAIAIVRTPKGCRASGATRFLDPDKALIQLSFRYLSDDQFWFTFFHEAGHLILHSKDAIFLEDESETTLEEESEANEFASEVLIPKQFNDALWQMQLSHREIIKLAIVLGVSPGIVLGQLQHRRRVQHNWLSKLKRRYSWDDIAG
jgi:HTH-type transcriptional regulator/antitoxin HigA